MSEAKQIAQAALDELEAALAKVLKPGEMDDEADLEQAANAYAHLTRILNDDA